ncbi:MAG: hypothetical protein ACRDR6_19915 [Pseudonocardiaceae bacterium]
MPGTATYIVYKTSDTTYNVLRTSDDSNQVFSTADAAIQTTLNLVDPTDRFSGGPGDVYIQAGRYDLTDSFTGFVMQSYTNLRLDGAAQIRVPWNYTGAVFQMTCDDGANLAGVTNSMIDGGRLIQRAGPQGQQPESNWTAFLLRGSTRNTLSGMQFNKIANTEVRLAGVGVSIVVDEVLGYVNSNTFEFLRMMDCRSFVSFQMAQLPFTTGNPIFANRFTDLQCDCGTTVRTEIGIRNVAGQQNTFDFVKVWDIQNGVAASGKANPLILQISSQAERTLIVGGILAGSEIPRTFIEDHGKCTTIVDSVCPP